MKIDYRYERKVSVIKNSNGEAIGYSMTLPRDFHRILGITPEERDVVMTISSGQVIMKKKVKK